MKENPLFADAPEEPQKPSGPVTCLGLTFANDAARRAHFTEELRKKLQDPAFRKIEGFPLGSDEDILALSDPPYYCACPNPWLADFIAEWEKQKPQPPAGYHYHREPFAADVSEGKNDPIYNAHSYHTKVPHKAVMRYILHYTEPGDVVFDGFCGTGMTGVAAQMCGDRAAVESLGYRVEPDGTILREDTGDDGKPAWRPFSRLGARHAVLNDLSPAATFIAYNYNAPVDVDAFEREAGRILAEVEKECGWMYETRHAKSQIGKINYTVWSDVFVCPECAGEVVFGDAAMNKDTGAVLKEFPCPHCGAALDKRHMERAWTTRFDGALNTTVKQAKQVPLLINYSFGKERYEKKPDAADLALIDKIEGMDIPYWFPHDRLMEGQETRRNDPIGITHVHHFYTKRNLWALAALYAKAFSASCKLSVFFVQYAALGFSKLARYVPTHFSQINQYLSGTLYIGSQQVEISPDYIFPNKLYRMVKHEVSKFGKFKSSITACSDSSNVAIGEKLCDYVFIDPPFGANLNYSELNFIWESWLKVLTNNKPEAIVNEVQGKDLDGYRAMMTTCFREAYRVLKPGRWMTVEFSNTSAAVWNGIQSALTEAGFIVANVAALDKQQGSFKAVTTPTAVKQDLIISAYKPNGGFEGRFTEEGASEAGAWDFVRTHLQYLPVMKWQGGHPAHVPERDPRILFDQMVAYYVRKGLPVPLSSQEFQAGLSQRFAERDGMFFLPEQATQYDKKRLSAPVQGPLFVNGEASAIDWLRNALREKPQTFQDLNPGFMKELSGWSKNETPLELSTLLEQNFLCYDGEGPVPEQIHAYLSSNWRELRNLGKDAPALRAKAKGRWYVPDPNKAGDLEKIREKALLKEFAEYKDATKKLKIFRLEAVRAGFKKAWQERDYATIVAVAEKIPQAVLEEDQKLLMWYDQAVTRMGDE